MKAGGGLQPAGGGRPRLQRALHGRRAAVRRQQAGVHVQRAAGRQRQECGRQQVAVRGGHAQVRRERRQRRQEGLLPWAARRAPSGPLRAGRRGGARGRRPAAAGAAGRWGCWWGPGWCAAFCCWRCLWGCIAASRHSLLACRQGHESSERGCASDSGVPSDMDGSKANMNAVRSRRWSRSRPWRAEGKRTSRAFSGVRMRSAAKPRAAASAATGVGCIALSLPRPSSLPGWLTTALTCARAGLPLTSGLKHCS